MLYLKEHSKICVLRFNIKSSLKLIFHKKITINLIKKKPNHEFIIKCLIKKYNPSSYTLVIKKQRDSLRADFNHQYKTESRYIRNIMLWGG